MKKTLSVLTAVIIIMSATGAFAGNAEYDCKAQIIQFGSGDSHKPKNVEVLYTSMENFRSKMTDHKYGEAKYKCTGNDEIIIGQIKFKYGKSSRTESVLTGRGTEDTNDACSRCNEKGLNISGIMPGIY